MRSTAARPQISNTGILAMLIGLGLVLFEFQTGFVSRRLGTAGHVAILVCGVAFSVWGLKEVISTLWPRLAAGGFHFALPRQGAVYLLMMVVLFIGALIGRSNTLMLVFSIMAGPWVMNGWFTFTMLRRLKMERDIPPRIMAGEPFTVALTLSNRKSWLPVWLMKARDTISHATGTLHPEVLFVRVPPASQRRGHYQVRLMTRGSYRLGPIDITTRFPLGLVERGVYSAADGELLVFPCTGHLRTDWRFHLQNSAELVSHVRPQTGPFNDDLYRIREYRPGDDTRLIHWRTSARMSELMVCDYKESRDRDLIVLVDTWLPKEADDDAWEDCERALRCTVTICMDQLTNSRESSLAVRLLGETLFDWRGDQGVSHFDALLDGLALHQASSKTNPQALIDGLEGFSTQKGRVLVITTRESECREVLTASGDIVLASAQVLSATESGLSSIYQDTTWEAMAIT